MRRALANDHSRQIASASAPLSTSRRILASAASFVQLDDHVALAVDPLGYFLDIVSRHYSRRLLSARHIQQFIDAQSLGASAAAHDQHRFAMALGGKQSDLGAALGDNGVGADGGAVNQDRGSRQEFLQAEASRLRRDLYRVEEALRRDCAAWWGPWR